MNRKDFVRTTSLATAAMMIPGRKLFAGNTENKVRIALLGTGLRGQDHLDLLLRRSDVELIAICDVSDIMLASAREEIEKSGKKMPQVYTGDDFAWKRLLEKEKVDGVIIATPWEWHKPMITGALEAGVKYVASEVILGITLQDHWDVV